MDPSPIIGNLSYQRHGSRAVLKVESQNYGETKKSTALMAASAPLTMMPCLVSRPHEVGPLLLQPGVVGNPGSGALGQKVAKQRRLQSLEGRKVECPARISVDQKQGV